MAEIDAHRTVRAVFRIESAKLIGALTRMVRDVGLAEDLAQDALVAALSHWPAQGVPDNPGAWLMATAKRRAIDKLRHDRLEAVKLEEHGRETDMIHETELSGIDDDVLRLMFVSCHPVLSPEARAALTLRLLGGLSTDEIARAYLVSESTVAQRIVRAKKTLAEAGVPFEIPEGAERAARLASVLEVLYLIFNEGYAATAGSDWMRPALCDEAMRLGRILAGLAPKDPDVHGLVALMELQASRSRARTGPAGEPVLLLDQDRALWDRLLIARGLASLTRAYKLGGAAGPYALQAAIAACHARALTAAQTAWSEIASLYDTLAEVTGSPVVELNRAMAHAMAFGPEAGLAILETLSDEPALSGYHALPAARGDLLFKLGRFIEARVEFERAAAMTRNTKERELLLARAKACVSA